MAIHKYGVFWLPEGNIKALITKWKRKLWAVEPQAVYVLHPVHMTLFLFMASDESEAQLCEDLASLAKTAKKVECAVKKWHVFKKDKAAKGGDTLVAHVDPSDDLVTLQLKIAKTFTLHRTGDILYPPIWKGVFAESLKKWGFPFVGDHWIAHISVGAAVTSTGKQILLKAMKSESPVCNCVISNLVLLRIDKDEHTPLYEVNLCGE